MSKLIDSLSDSTGYEEFRYVMQDNGNYYIGAKFTYADCMENEDIPFKFRAVIEHYLSKNTDISNTIESHLYYLTEDSFDYKTLKQLRAKVKVSVLVEKKKLFSPKKEYVYKEKILGIEDCVNMNLAQKKGSGLIIRELILSKLALMSFSI